MLKPFKSNMALTASASDRNGCDRLPRGFIPLTPVKLWGATLSPHTTNQKSTHQASNFRVLFTRASRSVSLTARPTPPRLSPAVFNPTRNTQ